MQFLWYIVSTDHNDTDNIVWGMSYNHAASDIKRLLSYDDGYATLPRILLYIEKSIRGMIMKNKRLVLIPVAVLVSLLLLFCMYNERIKSMSGDELLKNADLSNADSDGIPFEWYTDAYIQMDGYTSYELDKCNDLNGQSAMHITNHVMNDSRLAQEVLVDPDSIYCLSGWIKAKTVGGWGANLSVEGITRASNCLYDTAGEWCNVRIYGRTGPKQHQLTVFVRLGGYSGETLGEAWFTNLSLTKVSEAPEDVYVHNFYVQSSEQAVSQSFVGRFDLRHLLLLFYILLFAMSMIAFLRNKSALGLLILISVTLLLSVFTMFAEYTGDNEVVKQFTQPIPWLKYVLLTLAFIATAATISLVKNTDILRACMHTSVNAYPQRIPSRKEHKKLDWKDWVILSVVSIAYAGMAYTNLGSLTSPQTAFVFTDQNDQAVFDLCEYRTDFQMLYFGGIHYVDNSFTIEVSDDCETWSDPIPCEMQIGSLFQWQYVNNKGTSVACQFSGRYVRLTADNNRLTLYEVLFRDTQGNVLPVTLNLTCERDASTLIDEQNTLVGEPSWYNGMYFDEIYHARTAYEHLHKMHPYETSHPPLGKVLISWSIALWGMTPFGWRFAGATCGVLMLPGMYMLGKLLFSRRRYAVLSCLLLALDTMHFTQTRIATIDSFVVLFIIWAVYFMLCWFYTDIFRQKLWRTLMPLGLSGVFMGLAVASKWQGCYAGIGLAVVFFYGIYVKWSSLKPTQSKSDATEYNGSITFHYGVQRILITIASCLVFFVIIPLLIYWCSYIPYFAPSGGVTAQRIIQTAKSMLEYHSQPGLGMDHRFYSPWYQWPLSEVPMYYAAHGKTPVGYSYSIFAMGNYVVWWGGFIALLLTVYTWCKHQFVPRYCNNYNLKSCVYAPNDEADERPVLLIICFAAQFVPWILVPRGTYIYHYFPSIPFIILCTSYIFEQMNNWYVARVIDKQKGKTADLNTISTRADRQCLLLTVAYVIAAVVLFILFFPIASGILVRREWLNAINWFQNLYY